MGRAVWRVVINPQKGQFWGDVSFRPEKMCDYQRGSEQKVMISTSGPAAEILDGTDGCADKSSYERYWGFLKTVVPEARYDRTSSKNLVFGSVQDSGGTIRPRFIGASPVWAARSSYWRQPGLLYGVRGRALGQAQTIAISSLLTRILPLQG